MMAINRLHMCMIFIQILLTRGKRPLWKRPQIQCPYCDPNFIDVPNMQSAMQGYDLPMGDPNCNQSHYREVPRWDIFMEQELRFGLDLGRMANFPAFIASKSFDL